jgi:hypothetical protein
MGYAVGGSGTFIRTLDGGTTWTAFSTGTTYDLHSVHFTYANTGYAVGANGIILQTLNAGTTWTAESSGTTNTLESVYFPDANTGYAVGTGGTIIKTIDGGTTWFAESSGTTNTLMSVHFTDANTGYAAGAGGIILKTTDGGGSSSGLTIESQESRLSVYPDPATDKITIETSGVKEESTLAILNIEGQELIRQKIKDRVTQINISWLPGGIYFLKMSGERMVQVVKMIKD